LNCNCKERKERERLLKMKDEWKDRKTVKLNDKGKNRKSERE
jgi:hypothetical protein